MLLRTRLERTQRERHAWEERLQLAYSGHLTKMRNNEGPGWSFAIWRFTSFRGELFLAIVELVMHSVSSKNPRCVYLRAVCLTESWCVEYLYRGYFSPGWWIINEFVFDLVSWSWRSAWRCLCLNPLHPSLSDLPASLLHSFIISSFFI